MELVPEFSVSLKSTGNVQFNCLYHDDFIKDVSAVASHIHPYYEIYVNVSGDVSFLHGKTVKKMHSGGIVFSKPGELHHCIYHTPCIHEHYCVWFKPDENSEVERFLDKDVRSGIISLDNQYTVKLLKYLESIKNKKDFGADLEDTMVFLNLIMLLKKCSDTDTSKENDIPPTLQSVLEYIDMNFTEIHSVDDVSDVFHISTATLNRWFRQYVKLSPGRLIADKKLGLAERLLRQGSSVTEACFSAGFNDCSRFIAVFKQKYGETPLKYKFRK